MRQTWLAMWGGLGGDPVELIVRIPQRIAMPLIIAVLIGVSIGICGNGHELVDSPYRVP